MEAREVRCPGCFAPVDASRAVQSCRYCGTTLALQGAASQPAVEMPGQLFLEHHGGNLIQVIKVIRQNTGLGLKEAKDLAESAPCLVAQWPDPHRMEKFRQELLGAGARVR